MLALHLTGGGTLIEYGGCLCGGTSVRWVADLNVHSQVTVLAEGKGRLDVASLLDNIAGDQGVRAVRFFGEVAHVVTFKKTDPAFVIVLWTASRKTPETCPRQVRVR